MSIINIDESGIPKKAQIISSIEKAVNDKLLKKGSRLPSINSIRHKHKISRDTILKAYGELKSRGVIQSVAGKGYYLIKEVIDTSHRIFLLFDEFNAFKEDLYNSFIANLNSRVEVDIFFHHFNYEVFRSTIVKNAGNYSYYVIMPANLQNTHLILDFLPQNKVYILDQMHDELRKYAAVYQEFKKGVYEGLKKVTHRIQQYSKLVLVYNSAKEPKGILKGVQFFCARNHIPLEVIEEVRSTTVCKGNLYMTLEDSSLLKIIKQMKMKKLKLVKEVGIITYNDTVLKEVVINGITVISTNFSAMGKTLAKMILTNSKQKISNPISLIVRESI